MRGKVINLMQASVMPDVWQSGADVIPSADFPDPGMASEGYLVALTPFGPCVVAYTRYCGQPKSKGAGFVKLFDPSPQKDWFLGIHFVNFHHRLNALGWDRAYQDLLAFAAEYDVEDIWFRGDIIRVGTPQSRIVKKLRQDLAEVDAHRAYLTNTLAALGATPS